jgi:hypothetical protein
MWRSAREARGPLGTPTDFKLLKANNPTLIIQSTHLPLREFIKRYSKE